MKLNRSQLKTKTVELLQNLDFDHTLSELRSFPLSNTINILLGNILNTNDLIRWRAISACGALIADLAYQDLEAARVMVRRQLWNLTEESGGFAYGAPELVGESLANHPVLAREFAPSLISLIMPEGNYLEFEPLLRGAVWGVGRMAENFPEQALPAVEFLIPLLEYPEASVSGMAVWAAGVIDRDVLLKNRHLIKANEHKTALYFDHKILYFSVDEIIERIIGH